MNVNETIGLNIKKYRTAYQMTLKELSARLHKSISTVSKYEKGEIALDLPTFLEIAQIFRISPSVLLAGTWTPESGSPETDGASEALYMYTCNGPQKEIIQSLIEQFPPESPGASWQAHMYNDLRDFKRPGECGGFYSGTYSRDGFIGTYILRNQVSVSEHVLISCVKNLVNPKQQIGLVSGLSNFTMLPVTFKTVLSSVEITDRRALTDLLLFSKEDFRTMKHYHYLTVQNLR